jgi:hypothetical protein
VRECLGTLTDPGFRFGLLSGTSGCGKTSFLQAGPRREGSREGLVPSGESTRARQGRVGRGQAPKVESARSTWVRMVRTTPGPARASICARPPGRRTRKISRNARGLSVYDSAQTRTGRRPASGHRGIAAGQRHVPREPQALGRMRGRRLDRGGLPGDVPGGRVHRNRLAAQLRLLRRQLEPRYAAGRRCARRQGDRDLDVKAGVTAFAAISARGTGSGTAWCARTSGC